MLVLSSQAGGGVQELSDTSLRLISRLENMLMPRAPTLWEAWMSGALRRTLTTDLPRTLQVIQHTSQLVQQELRSEISKYINKRVSVYLFTDLFTVFIILYIFFI